MSSINYLDGKTNLRTWATSFLLESVTLYYKSIDRQKQKTKTRTPNSPHDYATIHAHI